MSKRPEPVSLQRLRNAGRVLTARRTLHEAVRRFFADRGYLEVQTPVRILAPALEDWIDALAADGQYLRTSPELHMKRLLAAGQERIFQTGPCFRAGETGSKHAEEFTMLEWYRAGADANDLLIETRDLLATVADAVLGTSVATFHTRPIDLAAPIEELHVDTAFATFATARTGADAAVAAGQFEQILADEIEAHLGWSEPCALTRYPAAMAALARLCDDDPNRAERWELYLGGLEIANAFTELTDPAEQRARFEATAELRRRNGREVYPTDEPFLDALEAGLPACAGIALGLDRLLMVLLDAPDIQTVLPFAAG